MCRQLFEDFNDFRMAHQQLGLVCGERMVEVGQRLVDEGQMVAAKVRGRHHTRLKGVEQDEWPTRLVGMVERLVVGDSKISFEPNHIDGR